MSKSKIKIIATAIVILLLLGTALGVVGYYSNGFKNWDKFKPSNWFNKDNGNDQVKSSVNNTIIETLTTNGVAFVCTNILAEDYAIKGVAENADSAYELIANIKPDIFDNKTINWNVRWINLNSAWAQGKDINKYLTFNKLTTQSGESVIVTCMQDFGEQIIITASAEADNLKKAQCTVDYVKKVKDVQIEFVKANSTIKVEDYQLDNDNVYRFEYNGTSNLWVIPKPIYSDYTIDCDYNEKSSVMKLSNTFYPNEDITIACFAPVFVDCYDYKTAFKIPQHPAYIFCESVSKIGRGVDTDANRKAYASAYMAYERMTDEQKANVIVSYYYQAITQTTIELQEWHKVSEYLDNNIPENPTSYAEVGLDLSYNDLFVNALKCNQEGKGIVECIIKIESETIVYEKIISLGFTTESLKAFCDIELNDDGIII